MTDLINRADAIEAVRKDIEFEKEHAIPYEDYDSGCIGGLKKAIRTLESLPSADDEPKWNCTANFVAEQLDRLKNMTDEEKWEFFKRFFGTEGGAE